MACDFPVAMATTYLRSMNMKYLDVNVTRETHVTTQFEHSKVQSSTVRTLR
jgi:hypothetical protein